MMSHNENLGPIISDSTYLRRIFSNCNNHINIAHVNCQSINPQSQSVKLDELRSLLFNSKIHIMGLSETWLKPEMSDRSVHIPGYSLCRSDRPPPGRAGGVGLLIANGLKYRKIFHSRSYNICESILIEVSCETTTILVGVVYLPSGNLATMEELLGEIFTQYNNIVIMGDFNQNLFDPVKCSNLRSFCNRLNLSCLHNSLPTHWNVGLNTTSLIDYFLLDDSSNIYLSGQGSVPFLQSYHSLIYVSLPFMARSEDRYVEYRDFERVDHNEISCYIDRFDFSSFYGTACINSKLTVLNTLLYDLYELVPVVKFKPKYRKDPWMNERDVVVTQSLRDLAYVTFKEYKTEENRKAFCKLRNKVKSLIRKFRRRHHVRIFDGANNSRMWKILNNSGGSGKDNVCLHNIDVNDLNNSFIFNNADNRFTSFNFDTYNGDLNGFSFDCVNADDLWNALSRIKSNSIGTDGFPIKFIKLVFPYVIDAFIHLFNMIITTSSYPDGWKLARVVPIHKKGSANDFRPISILPALSKVMEHILKLQILDHVSQNNLLNDVQYAYRNRYSTSAMLLGITETVREYLNEDSNCILVSLDLTKAFDRLNHATLIEKLKHKFGFSIMACKLIYSYLHGRSQFVSLRGIASNILPVFNGVPQGSVLGPILFLMYLDDCVDSLDLNLVKPFIFADDIQLLFGNCRVFPDVLEATINYTLDRLYSWMLVNSFSINAAKTKAIMFRTGQRNVIYPNIQIHGECVNFVDSLVCLGVVIDEYLNFGKHLDVVSSRVTLGLRRLYHCGLHLPTKVRYTIAHTLLMSHVNYCIEVDSGTVSYNLNKLELIVKRIVRYVYGFKYRDHVSNAMHSFLGCSLMQYLKLRNLIFFYKVIKYGVPNYLFLKFAFSRSVRNPQIIIPLITCSVYERSFLIRTARNWNVLPCSLKTFSASHDVFRNRLLSHFQNNH